MSKFCGQCGLPVGENDKFCAACGAPNHAAAAEPPRRTPETTAVRPAPARSSKIGAALAPAWKRGLRRRLMPALLIAVLVGDGVWFSIPYVTRHAVLTNAQGDPCRFLSRQEVEHVMGSSFREMRPTPPTCDYFTSGTTNWIRTEYHSGDGVAYMGALRKTAKMFDLTVTPVAGVGDEAYFDAADKTLSVRKRNNVVIIDLRFSPDAFERAKALAGKIATRM